MIERNGNNGPMVNETHKGCACVCVCAHVCLKKRERKVCKEGDAL